MKRFLLSFLTIFLLIACNTTRSYDRKVAQTMQMSNNLTMECCYVIDTVMKTCREHVTEIISSGGCSALDELYLTLVRNGTFDSLKLHQKEFIEQSSLLSNPPKEREEMYRDFCNIMFDVTELCREILSPAQNYLEYYNSCHKMIERILLDTDAFNVKHAESLDKK